MRFDFTGSLKRFPEVHVENCYFRESEVLLELEGIHPFVSCVPQDAASPVSCPEQEGEHFARRQKSGTWYQAIPRQLSLAWDHTAWWSCEMIKAYIPGSWVVCTAYSLLFFAVLFFFNIQDLKCDWMITELVIPFQHWASPSLLLALSPTLLQETHMLLPQICNSWYDFLARS